LGVLLEIGLVENRESSTHFLNIDTMGKAPDYNTTDKYREVPCNCHPETCGCGGTRTVKNPMYVPKEEEVKDDKKKK
jgi:hypothetical protein